MNPIPPIQDPFTGNTRAIQNSLKQINKYLTSAPQNSRLTQIRKNSLLSHACAIGDQIGVQLLLSSVEDPSDLIMGQNELGQTPLHVINREADSREIASALIRKKPEVLKIKDICGRTPIHHLFLDGANASAL